jgi:hypothetical protein
MRCHEEDVNPRDFLDALPAGTPSNPERSPGLHVSQIYGDVMKTVDPKRFGDGELPWGKVATGLMFERAIETALSAVFHDANNELMRPGEFELDGIACSPDTIDFKQWVLYEFKCTWMSARQEIIDKKFMHWIIQIKAYCKVLSMRRAILYILFVNGKYDGEGPIMRKVELTFEQHEIDANWNMLVKHAKKKGWL